MANKITKRDTINAMLEVEVIASNEQFKSYLEHELELLDKKKASKGQTKTQKENVGVKAEIIRVLDEAKSPMTVTEILAVGGFAEGTTNQKISSLLRQLVEAKAVIRTEGKKTLYSLPTLYCFRRGNGEVIPLSARVN